MPRETATAHARTQGAPSRKKTAGPATVSARADRAARTAAYKARMGRPITALADMSEAGVGTQLMSTAHRYTRTLEQALAADRTTVELTVPRLQLLQVLSAHQGISGAEAARALGVRPQTLTTLLRNVAELGWIAEVGRIGRAKDHVLTAEGRKVLKKGQKVQARVEEALAQAYSHDGVEVQALTKLLAVGREHMTAGEAVR